ncbi:pathogenicity island protein [Staphylococcus haemolyticus]|uniref:pathogenicity island protein n=1 Tax=Staphylococcus haemolyticus TaxID=1283 RepID=UPI0018B0D3CE|nr:pathogenicity island protein [Staphylococcus haemolyticus]MBF9289121.1 pathogenicity island protein [Staphylococcus haemolyticus]
MIKLERGARIHPYIYEEAFVQIMPAPDNLYSRTKDANTGEYIYSPIPCMALTNCGQIVFCDTDDMGNIDEINNKLIFKYNDSTKQFENWSKYQNINIDKYKIKNLGSTES